VIKQNSILAKKKNVTCTELPDGEAVLLNLENRYFYTLNQDAFSVWKHLNGKYKLIDIADRIVKQSGIDIQEAVGAVLEQAGEFMDEGLIEIAP
jgi:hypothetical protein